MNEKTGGMKKRMNEKWKEATRETVRGKKVHTHNWNLNNVRLFIEFENKLVENNNNNEFHYDNI